MALVELVSRGKISSISYFPDQQGKYGVFCPDIFPMFRDNIQGRNNVVEPY